ncbi:MAG: ribosome biogenesis GTP-binding protein YihA/YsxC [Bacteroidales bacterium]|nr:ribosome biogenesis GTP-binding protein YihA/YsxC [Bacteroidales bacterium]MDT8432087.1 ribosome biogenesis GTP-binding protein YihA/YsxC [Bacteroidales bacterium]
MIIREAKFITSSQTVAQCPKGDLPEYAFIGRSNVGKSSLINMLVERKNLAKTSSTPGKTRLINHFLIDDSWYLCDLPGYGYAKVSKKQREAFAKMIEQYAIHRTNLVCFFVLIDSRIPPQELDLDFIDWLGDSQLPFVLLYTKCDKVGQKERYQTIEKMKEHLSESWDELPLIIETSAVKGTGRDQVMELIKATNEKLKAND